jgi:hypothetical protein
VEVGVIEVRNMIMKKIVLGLALCLGLSQVVVAEKLETKGLPTSTKGAMAWIKANPVKAGFIAAGITAALAGTAYTGYEMVTFKTDKTGFFSVAWAKIKGGAETTFHNAKKVFKREEKELTAEEKAAQKEVKSLYANHKTAFLVSGAVLVVIAAAVIADIATTDKDAQTRMAQLWNKLFSKNSDNTVVANS